MPMGMEMTDLRCRSDGQQQALDGYQQPGYELAVHNTTPLQFESNRPCKEVYALGVAAWVTRL
jgi:hypothetical protein